MAQQVEVRQHLRLQNLGLVGLVLAMADVMALEDMRDVMGVQLSTIAFPRLNMVGTLDTRAWPRQQCQHKCLPLGCLMEEPSCLLAKTAEQQSLLCGGEMMMVIPSVMLVVCKMDILALVTI
jgi:hypothetical protein